MLFGVCPANPNKLVLHCILVRLCIDKNQRIIAWFGMISVGGMGELTHCAWPAAFIAAHKIIIYCKQNN